MPNSVQYEGFENNVLHTVDEIFREEGIRLVYRISHIHHIQVLRLAETDVHKAFAYTVKHGTHIGYKPKHHVVNIIDGINIEDDTK